MAIQLPQMPANLDTLTDEELRVMEENTRRGCLARLKYITDIKCMLDTAMVMMNHYSSACLIAGYVNIHINIKVLIFMCINREPDFVSPCVELNQIRLYEMLPFQKF